MKNLFIQLIISFFAIPCLMAQHTNIFISDKLLPNEPSIMINPKNTNEMMAGANMRSFYVSDDGGQTWINGYLNSTWGVWGDPVIVVDTAGAFYFFHLSNYDCGTWIDRIVCQKTVDNGQSWSDGSYAGLNGTKNQDKEWVVVNRTNNHLYACWTQFDKYDSKNIYDSSHILFSKSTDGGLSWEDAVRLDETGGDCIDDDATVEGAVPAIGPGGELYVSWAGPDGIYFDKSTDEGKTWLNHDIFVSTQPGGWNYDIPGLNRCNGLPVTDCDTSNGPYRGNIYINWSDQRNGIDNTDIWFSKSSDQGNSWSVAKKVNDDSSGRHQFLTWMTVDQSNGNIYFVFYDRRAYNDELTDVYMAISKDGGETFKNFKISESPFLPGNDIFFGDYTNISAFNNVVRPIWTRLHERKLSIWTAVIDINAVDIKPVPESGLFVIDNYPNPSSDISNFSFKLTKGETISLHLYNSFGKQVATIINQQFYNAGKYVESVNLKEMNLPSGLYFFELQSGNSKAIRKFIFSQ